MNTRIAFIVIILGTHLLLIYYQTDRKLNFNAQVKREKETQILANTSLAKVTIFCSCFAALNYIKSIVFRFQTISRTHNMIFRYITLGFN